MDPLAGSSWSAAATVAGFRQSPPNETLMRFARQELARVGSGTALDIGCGAARNALPMAELGWNVIGTDLSLPMLDAAAERVHEGGQEARVKLLLAPMDHLPVGDAACDLVVAHGIWNLATSGREFRQAVREAARVAAPGAGLFVFTFSRHTLSDDAVPVTGESFVFTDFSGAPQCFLRKEELVAELSGAGFVPDPSVPFSEHNLPKPGTLHTRRVPVIYEAAFRRV